MFVEMLEQARGTAESHDWDKVKAEIYAPDGTRTIITGWARTNQHGTPPSTAHPMTPPPQLDEVWYEASAADGTPYFYSNSGEVTWSKPSEPAASEPAQITAMAGPSSAGGSGVSRSEEEWFEACTPRGTSYFHNSNGDVRWDHPGPVNTVDNRGKLQEHQEHHSQQSTQQQTQMQQQAQQVQEVQRVPQGEQGQQQQQQQRKANGTPGAEGQSSASSSTVATCSEATTEAIPPSQPPYHYNSSGEAASRTKQAAATTKASATPVPTVLSEVATPIAPRLDPNGARAARSNEDDWYEAHTARGTPYYHNDRGAVSWDAPTSPKSAANFSSSLTEWFQALRGNTYEAHTARGTPYYHNDRGAVSWDAPTSPPESAGAAVDKSSSPSSSAGWFQAWAEDGTPYYHNLAGEVRWEVPASPRAREPVESMPLAASVFANLPPSHDLPLTILRGRPASSGPSTTRSLAAPSTVSSSSHSRVSFEAVPPASALSRSTRSALPWVDEMIAGSASWLGRLQQDIENSEFFQ